jgi:putative FmdB family regulatory protein
MSDEPPKECPKCGKQELKKLIGVPALKFNGTGWTEKHYK